MPVNFRKAKDNDIKCSSCGASYSDSVAMYEYKIGRQKGVLCDLCLKDLFSKTLQVTCMIDKEKKDRRQINVINSRNCKHHSKESSMMSINEALRGIDDNEA